MSSLIRPLEDIASCEIPYWLPPGGRDNGVWADTWELIADLGSGDVTTVLDLLAAADIGGYVAVPGGRKARAKGGCDAVRLRGGRADPVHAAPCALRREKQRLQVAFDAMTGTR